MVLPLEVVGFRVRQVFYSVGSHGGVIVGDRKEREEKLVREEGSGVKGPGVGSV